MRLQVMCHAPHVGVQGRIIVPIDGKATVGELARKVAGRATAILPEDCRSNVEVSKLECDGAVLWEDDLVEDVVEGQIDAALKVGSAGSDTATAPPAGCGPSPDEGKLQEEVAELCAEVARTKRLVVRVEAEHREACLMAEEELLHSRRLVADAAQTAKVLGEEMKVLKEVAGRLESALEERESKLAEKEAQLAEKESELQSLLSCSEPHAQLYAKEEERRAVMNECAQLRGESVTWQAQCEKLIGLISQRDEEVENLNQAHHQLQKEYREVKDMCSVWEEQCQQLSDALSKTQDMAQEAAMRVHPMSPTFSSRESIDESAAVQATADLEKDLADQSNLIASLKEALRAKDLHIDTLQASYDGLEKRVKDFEEMHAALKRNAVAVECGAMVKEMVSDAVLRAEGRELKAVTARLKAVELDHRRMIAEVDRLQCDASNVEQRITDVRNEHKIDVKKKDNLIRELREQLFHLKQQQSEQQEGGAPTPPPPPPTQPGEVTLSAIEHENNILVQRLSAAEELNEALQKMLREQEGALVVLTEDNQRKTAIIENFAITAVGELPGRLGSATPTTDEKRPTKKGKGVNTHPNQHELQMALEEALAANIRLRRDVQLLGDEIAKLQGERKKALGVPA